MDNTNFEAPGFRSGTPRLQPHPHNPSTPSQPHLLEPEPCSDLEGDNSNWEDEMGAPFWTADEKAYFINHILPLSHYATGSFKAEGLDWPELAIRMQVNCDRLGIAKRTYTASSLFQHWYQKISKRAKGRGEADRLSSTPSTSARGSSPSSGRVGRHNRAGTYQFDSEDEGQFQAYGRGYVKRFNGYIDKWTQTIHEGDIDYSSSLRTLFGEDDVNEYRFEEVHADKVLAGEEPRRQYHQNTLKRQLLEDSDDVEENYAVQYDKKASKSKRNIKKPQSRRASSDSAKSSSLSESGNTPNSSTSIGDVGPHSSGYARQNHVPLSRTYPYLIHGNGGQGYHSRGASQDPSLFVSPDLARDGVGHFENFRDAPPAYGISAYQTQETVHGGIAARSSFSSQSCPSDLVQQYPGGEFRSMYNGEGRGASLDRRWPAEKGFNHYAEPAPSGPNNMNGIDASAELRRIALPRDPIHGHKAQGANRRGLNTEKEPEMDTNFVASSSAAWSFSELPLQARGIGSYGDQSHIFSGSGEELSTGNDQTQRGAFPRMRAPPGPIERDASHENQYGRPYNAREELFRIAIARNRLKFPTVPATQNRTADKTRDPHAARRGELLHIAASGHSAPAEVSGSIYTPTMNDSSAVIDLTTSPAMQTQPALPARPVTPIQTHPVQADAAKTPGEGTGEVTPAATPNSIRSTTVRYLPRVKLPSFNKHIPKVHLSDYSDSEDDAESTKDTQPAPVQQPRKKAKLDKAVGGESANLN